MKKLLLLLLLLCAMSSFATETRVQHKTSALCGTSCPITVTTTGTGNLLLVGCFAASATAGRNCTNVTGAGTWVHPAGCVASSTTAIGATDHWYNLSSTAGVTTITVTFGNANGTQNVAWVEEISTTATPWTFGACAVLSNQGATTSPLTPSITPNGAANAMFGIVFTAGTINAGSAVTGSGWTTPIVDAPTGDGADDGLDFAGGTTQATFTSTSAAYCSSGIWFKDATGGPGAVPGVDKKRKLEQMDPS